MGKCIGNIAMSAVPDCNNPLIKQYTGRALLIQLDEVADLTSLLTYSPTNNTVTVDNMEGLKALHNVAVENTFVDPATRFADAQTTSSADDGIIMYLKTWAFKAMRRGSAFSKSFVEAAAGSVFGFVAFLEKEDKCGDGSYEVVGIERGLKVNADGISRQEASAAGTNITMSTTESKFEVALTDEDGAFDYGKIRAVFEELYNAALA